VEKILQILLVVILSATKFLTAPITSLNIGFGYLETLLITTVGGIFGVIFFYYLSTAIVFLFSKVIALFVKQDAKPKPKRKFTWKNKLIVRVKRDYGLIGLAAITPTFLSIPVGTFLASRYFHDQKKVLVYLCASVVVWSVIVSSVVIIF
jgi:ABC-type antimicrobial peptide transport system permease subunit